MSSNAIVLTLQERSVSGKKVKTIRRSGLVPAVISEKGQDSINVQGVYLDVERAYHAAGKHRPVEIKLGSKNKLAMIKDISMDPVKHVVTHVAFHAIKLNEKVDAEVGIKITGDVPAERLGLTVLDTLREVEIKALPNNLPEVLEVDGSNLKEVGDKLRVSDIKAVDGVEILTDPETTIAVVEMPRDAESEAAKEAEEAASQVSAADVPADNGTEKPTEA